MQRHGLVPAETAKLCDSLGQERFPGFQVAGARPSPGARALTPADRSSATSPSGSGIRVDRWKEIHRHRVGTSHQQLR